MDSRRIAYRDSNANGDTHVHSQPNRYAHTNSNSYTDCDARLDSNSDAELYAETDSNRKTRGYPQTEANPGSSIPNVKSRVRRRDVIGSASAAGGSNTKCIFVCEARA